MWNGCKIVRNANGRWSWWIDQIKSDINWREILMEKTYEEKHKWRQLCFQPSKNRTQEEEDADDECIKL